MYEATLNPTYLVTGDFNKDNKLDVITANSYYDSMSILFGNGNGTFQKPITYLMDGGLVFIATADLNNDTNLDLVVVSDSPDVFVIFGNGDGTFQDYVAYELGNFAIAVAIADYNNDQLLDIAVTNHYGTSVGILFGHGNGTFDYHDYVSSTAGPYPSFIVTGDFNKDMKLDIAVTNAQDGNVAVLLNSCS